MIDLTTYTAFFVFLIGACIGSFLNVVALRGLSNESIVFPPSKCPKCDNQLNWYTNIPIISYIFLRGRCEFCKEHISLQYPIVESLNALLYLAVFLTFGFTFKTIFMCILISLFIVISITDFKETVVLDVHTYIIIVLGLIMGVLPFWEVNFIQSIIGIGAGFILFELLARIGYLFAGTRAFGEGDTLIAMGLGAVFGWAGLIIITFLAVVVQAFISLPMLFYKSVKSKEYKEAAAYCTLVAGVIAVYLFRVFNLYENFMVVLLLLLIVFAVLGWALVTILKDIRKKREGDNYLYLPFGPALMAAGGLMIFFKPYIYEVCRNLLVI